MKSAPIKIIVAIIFTGIVCIFGELILSRELSKTHKQHNEIMDEYVQNREYMATINTLIYEHQALLVNHLLSNSQEAREQYLLDEKELRKELTDLIISFSYRIKGGRREQIYHKVYSDFAGYENNADALLTFGSNGEQDMAVYYNDNVLKPFLVSIDLNLKTLDDMTIEEIEAAEDTMQKIMKESEILRNVCIAVMTILIIICTAICFSITKNLDKYKQDLEKELEEKNRVLQEKNENMIRLQDGIIIGMANLIESRDGDTGEHVIRTSVYAEMLAKEARRQGIYADILTDEYIERLKKAAPLHDVGKICVPDSILMKPGKLTADEFESIKLHSIKGGEIIKECFENIEDRKYVNMAIDVASYHHEKWDGSGYSVKLEGDAIPLSARIMAIADVFDALISKRCYKEAFPIDKAYEIIEESIGSHFDPQLGKVFLDMKPAIEEYLKDKKTLA